MTADAKPRAPQLPDELQAWLTQGWLRGTDGALAALLAEEGGETDLTVLLLTALVSRQVGDGHTRLDLAALLDKPASLWPEPPKRSASEPAETQRSAATTPPEWLAHRSLDQLCAALADSAVVAVATETTEPPVDSESGNTPLVLVGHHLYLRRYWSNEQTIQSSLRHRLETPKTTVPGLGPLLDTLFPREDKNPDWQRVACALASRSPFTLITGGPGTGKTRTVLRLLALLQAQRLDTDPDEPLRIRLAAPTGKAAARLSESISGEIDALPLPESVRAAIPREVTTLHRLLSPRPGSRLFRHDRHNPLHADLVVVDEASMIDQELTARLLDALRPETRLVLLGDKDQLASVEAGAVLGELCEGADSGQYTAETVAWVSEHSGDNISAWQAGGTPLLQHIVKLRESRRFRGDGGIGAFAEAVRTGDFNKANALLDSDKPGIARLTLNASNAPALDQACAQGYRHYLEILHSTRPIGDDWEGTHGWAQAVLEALARFQVLAAVRQGPLGVGQLNRRIARQLKHDGWIERDHGWFEGRPVMVTRNDYESGLRNGDVGICLNTRLPGEAEPRLRVAFELPGYGIRLFLPSRLEAIESVFAMTVHKSQGSEFREVLVVLPQPGLSQSGRELLYTAVTRARERSVIAAPPLDK